MDRSFPFFNKWKILVLALVAVLATAMDAVYVTITDLEPSMYGSTYATTVVTLICLAVLMAQEQISKWNSFLIASGTDRSEFMRTRFIRTILFVALSAVLLTCIDIAFHGLSDNRIVLLMLNVTLVLIACSIFMYIFCRMGMTIRSQVQMSVLLVVMIFLVMFGNSLVINISTDINIDVIPIVWVLVASVGITVLSYLACMRRIKRVDM